MHAHTAITASPASWVLHLRQCPQSHWTSFESTFEKSVTTIVHTWKEGMCQKLSLCSRSSSRTGEFQGQKISDQRLYTNDIFLNKPTLFCFVLFYNERVGWGEVGWGIDFGQGGSYISDSTGVSFVHGEQAPNSYTIYTSSSPLGGPRYILSSTIAQTMRYSHVNLSTLNSCASV